MGPARDPERARDRTLSPPVASEDECGMCLSPRAEKSVQYLDLCCAGERRKSNASKLLAEDDPDSESVKKPIVVEPLPAKVISKLNQLAISRNLKKFSEFLQLRQAPNVYYYLILII